MKNLKYILGVLFILKCVTAYSAEITLGRVDIDSIAVVRNAFGRMMIDYDITKEDMHGNHFIVRLEPDSIVTVAIIVLTHELSEYGNPFAYSKYGDSDIILSSGNKNCLELMGITLDNTRQKTFDFSEKGINPNSQYWIYQFIDDKITCSESHNVPLEKIRIREDCDDFLAYKIYFIATVDVIPQFQGGEEALSDWIAQLPKKAEEMAGVKSPKKIISIFILIKPDGSTALPEDEYVRLRNHCPELAQSLRRLIEAMPKWEPGKIKDKAVTVLFVLSLKFQ